MKAALLPLCVSVAGAETITYHLTESTSQTLRSLGGHFVAGCGVLAGGFVIAAAISRKK